MSQQGRTGRRGRRGERGRSVFDSRSVGGEKQGFWMGRPGGWLITILIWLGAAVPFVLGKYFEFNTPDPFDSSGFVYSAHRVLEGAQIGVDEVPSAQIGTLWVNMLGVKLFGYSEVGPKLLQGVMQAGALLMMFFMMRRLFGRLAAGVGVIMASLYLSAPFIAKFGNVKEQYMIACMVGAICFLIMQQLGGGWWWAVLSGVCIIWAPMFKQTGLSVFGAVGLFLVLQPILKHRRWRQAGKDILWVWLGIFIGLAPAAIWKQAAKADGMELPHEFVWRTLKPVAVLEGPAGVSEACELRLVSWAEEGQETEGGGYQEATSYIGASRALSSLGQQAKVVFRFYRLLILPISLALGAIVLRLVRWVMGRKQAVAPLNDRFVLLLGVWWVIDMAFVWVSPRSYEQYYLPLNASAAMLGGYLVGWYALKRRAGSNRGLWGALGAGGLLVILAMVGPIVFGISRSPHHGGPYTNSRGEPEKQNGYVQKMQEVQARKRGGQPMWEVVAEMVGERSAASDRLYVWGWYPGIYVMSQRDSATNRAVYGNMHSDPPDTVRGTIIDIVRQLEAAAPKFIIDSQKGHYPFYDHPNFDLWPRGRDRAGELVYLPVEALASQREQMLDLAEEQSLGKMTAANHPNGPIAEDRAQELAKMERARHAAMFPLREFVMQRYEPILQPGVSMFVFQRKDGLGR